MLTREFNELLLVLLGLVYKLGSIALLGLALIASLAEPAVFFISYSKVGKDK
jgi:hypothetical protein